MPSFRMPRIAISILSCLIAGPMVGAGPARSSLPQTKDEARSGAEVQEREQQSTYHSFLSNPGLKARERDRGERRDDAAGRIDWWRQHMGGEFTTEFKQRLISEAEKERAKHPGVFLGDLGAPLLPTAVGGAVWTPIGPTDASKEQNGPTYFKVDSGRARTILPVPGDPNTVYFLTSGGGLWKTTNFLTNPPIWTALTDSLGSTSGGAAAFGGAHPGGTLNASVLYVGLGDPFDGGVGGIMAKSTDGGATFPAPTKIVLPGVSKVYDIKVDFSGSSDMVLVGTNAGLFRSTNGGASYAPTGALTSGDVWSIVKTAAGWLASVEIGGNTIFYLSTDGAATWTASTGVNTPQGIGRTTFGIGAPGDAVVYAFAATTNDGSQKDLYRSPDGGATWVSTQTNSTTIPTNPNGDQPDNDFMAGQAFYNQMILVDPTDATRNTVYLGGELSAAKSTNGGSAWTIITNWLPGGSSGTASLPYVHADFHAAAFLAGTPNRIFFGTDGGLFVSGDGGTTWDDTKNKGLQSHLVYALACGFNGGADRNSVLIGLQDNGARLRKSNTLVYDQTQGGDGFGVGWSQANNAWSLESYVYNAISLCTSNPPDDQSKWNDFVTGLGSTNGNSYYFVTPIISAPASSDAASANPGMNFYTYGNSGSGANSKTIFKSTPTGWTVIGTAGSGGISAGRFVRPESHGIGVSPVDLNHLAAAGNGGVALITTNGGTTWTERAIASLGVPNWPGFNANLAWADNSKIYLCSVATAAGVPRVVKSLNGGANWTDITPGLPDVPVIKLAVDPGDASGDTVYAATWLGIYRTTNGGASWAPCGTGQPQGYVSDIYVAPDSSFLRIAYYGRGIWELNGAAVPTGPTITAQPADQIVTVGQTATFSVAATTSGGALSYQWKKGSATVGGNSASYTTPATVLGDNGATFNVAITDSNGTTLSNQATLTVNNPLPVITVSLSPNPVAIVTGGSQTFTAVVTGSSNPAVTWSLAGGGNLGNVTGSSATVTAPSTPGSLTLTATSVADTSRTAFITFPVRSRDLNGDGSVDVLDLASMAAAFGTHTAAADLNGDGTVDDLDIDIFLTGF